MLLFKFQSIYHSHYLEVTATLSQLNRLLFGYFVIFFSI
ncbi:hypothetical protein LPE509_02648 [Legionella pneumophila subsp. pneumophila LPE509]|nr:hypothetical protein LPE509_02648 [Legionella pneumophila subsp. pneumophila LPE509]